MRPITRRRPIWVAAALSILAGGVSALALAPPASAASAQVDYICTTTAFGVGYDNSIVPLTVTMTSPLTADAGTSAAVTIQASPLTWDLPFAATNAVAVLQATVDARRVGGGASATATGVSAPTSPSTIAAYSTFPVTQPLTVNVPTTSAGFIVGDKIDYFPSTIAVTLTSADDGLSGATAQCSPFPAPATTALARTTVSGAIPATPTDRCVAQSGDTTGQPGCDTQQVVQLDVAAGSLTQRAYTTGTNPSSTIIDLGAVTSPFVPTSVPGVLNAITVTDNRGGSFGWSLTAALTDFTGNLGGTINKSKLTITPACTVATTGQAYDYDAPGASIVAGYNPALVAPGQAPGTAGQSFGSPVVLCTKTTDVNTTTQSSGGIYTVAGVVGLEVPAFQSAQAYSAIMTITLA